jgi:hypothetical protein
MSVGGAHYGSLPSAPSSGEAGTSAGSRSRSTGARLVVALLVAVTVGTIAVVSQREQPQQVDLAAAPAASDFFASALQGLESQRFARAVRSDGVRGRAPRGHKEVSLRTDKHGDVNLNVDIERNGKLVGQDRGLKVPVGKATTLQLAVPRKGRLQQLDEDVPVMPAYADDDAADEDNQDGDEDNEQPVDDDDISELGTAKKQVQDARQRVVEDAKRLHEISHAISEESEKAENAQDYKVAAIQGEEDAKRRAIEEVEEEKEALRAAKKRADALAITKESEAMKAKMQAAEARSAALTAKARADAAEQACAP